VQVYDSCSALMALNEDEIDPYTSKLSDTRVYEPQIRARLGTTAGGEYMCSKV